MIFHIVNIDFENGFFNGKKLTVVLSSVRKPKN